MTTTSDYLTVSQNLSRYQAMTAAEPAVKLATAYYKANIGKVTSIADLVGNYRLLSYALKAYGLGDQINAKALITKVLQGGISDSRSLANTLKDTRWKAFATAFNFVDKGASSIAAAGAVDTATKAYVEQQLEADQGNNNVGVQLALYFKRVAPTVTNKYGLLADNNLTEVAQTIFGLSSASSVSAIDTEAKQLNRLLQTTTLQDPKKLQQLVLRFTAMYDLTYGASSGATSALSVASNDASANVSGASSVLSGVISSNAQSIAKSLGSFTSATTPTISNSLLASVMRLRLGG
jgi:hypothetical protein